MLSHLLSRHLSPALGYRRLGSVDSERAAKIKHSEELTSGSGEPGREALSGEWDRRQKRTVCREGELEKELSRADLNPKSKNAHLP